MKYFYTLLFVAILFPLFSFAQENYKPGLVVTLKGDTIHGFIDYKEWENNPSAINFKAASASSAQLYTPAEIRYFRINGSEAYQAYSGPVSMDEINVNRLAKGRDTTFRTVSAFLKIEQDGKFITLYSFTDDLKKRYFVSEKANNQPVELIYKIYYSTSQDNNQTITDEKYKGQLIYISSKYNGNTDNLRLTIQNSNYDQELVDVAAKINHSGKQARQHVNRSTSFYASISSGATYIRASNSDYSNFNPRVSPSYSYLPRVALGINAYTNPDVGRLVFKGEIAVQVSHDKTYFYEYLYGNARSYNTVNQNTISFNPNVLYNIYNAERFKFYVEAGVSANFSNYSNISYYNGQYKTLQNDGTIYAGNWFSFPLEAGVTLNKKFGLFVNYTPPTPISGAYYNYYSTKLGFSYTF